MYVDNDRVFAARGIVESLREMKDQMKMHRQLILSWIPPSSLSLFLDLSLSLPLSTSSVFLLLLRPACACRLCVQMVFRVMADGANRTRVYAYKSLLWCIYVQSVYAAALCTAVPFKHITCENVKSKLDSMRVD